MDKNKKIIEQHKDLTTFFPLIIKRLGESERKCSSTGRRGQDL